MSRGTTADIDPQAWEIVEGRLYLNLDKDIQKIWATDKTGYIHKADRKWPAVLGR